MLIGITGCIGSGKSYILDKIHKIYGYEVYSADDFVVDSYNDEKIKRKLDEVFNCVIDNKVDKSIIKSKLNDNNIILLNNIIHPYVKEKITSLNNTDLVFVEVPLLFESKMDDLFDYIISISVDDKIRHLRIKNRNRENYQNMIKLEKYQYDNDKKASLADFVIYNGKDDLNILNQIDNIISKIKRK